MNTSIPLVLSLVLTSCVMPMDGMNFSWPPALNMEADHSNYPLLPWHQTFDQDRIHQDVRTRSTAPSPVHSSSGWAGEQRSELPSGTAVIRDNNGLILRSESSTGDSTTVRDASGRIMSNRHRLPSGTEIERSAGGEITRTASSNPSGDIITYRDGNGRILGSKYTSPAGNVTYRDANGVIRNSIP